MPRYFIELSYKGTAYSGFQIQQNSNTIQAEITKAIKIISGIDFELTGSSRTDAGVHALQNYFHFDSDIEYINWKGVKNEQQLIYKLNAILPCDIAIKCIYLVPELANCRFDAISREYRYYVYQFKNPFLETTAYYYPYKLNIELLNQAAELMYSFTDFTSFSKRNTQVKTFNCKIIESKWEIQGEKLVYYIKANRFLRGMVKAMVATQLKVGREILSIQQFIKILEERDSTKAFFSVPSRGLFLEKVYFSNDFFNRKSS